MVIECITFHNKSTPTKTVTQNLLVLCRGDIFYYFILPIPKC